MYGARNYNHAETVKMAVILITIWVVRDENSGRKVQGLGFQSSPVPLFYQVLFLDHRLNLVATRRQDINLIVSRSCLFYYISLALSISLEISLTQENCHDYGSRFQFTALPP